VQNQCRHLLLVVFALLATAVGVANSALAQINSLSFKGFNYVSYYNGAYESADSLPALVGTGANSVALTFEYGIDVQHSAVYADVAYTENLTAIAATIVEANSRGLSVMVRPLIDFLDPTKIGSYSLGDWRSFYNPTNPAAFFASYKAMIVDIATVAQANGATSLSIAAELDQLTGPNYLSYWTDIIATVRTVFSGKLTYSADWDDNISPWQGQHGLTAGTGNLATQVSFWNQLDYLGIDCYAPISDAASPVLADLIAGWAQVPSDPTSKAVTGNQSLISYFESVAAQTGKPLLFTELGYESASDAARQPAGTSTNIYDPALQANLYAAFFAAWQQSANSLLLGVYFWNWDPNAAEVGPGNGPNFSPQGQPAQAVVTTNFSTPSPTLEVAPATNISSSGQQGGPFSPSSFNYTVATTSGTRGYSISGVPSWLTASSTSGTVNTTGTTVTFTVNASANSLPPTTYSTTITFTDTTSNTTALTISATLTVNAMPGSLQVTPATDMASVGNPGGPFSPSLFQYQLSTNNGTVNYSISGLPAWLNVSSASGTVTTTPITITFTVNSNANSVAIGGYNATISFSNTTNGQGNQTRNAALTVNSGGTTLPAMRTWVSGTGDDGNDCTLTAPCLTFAGAISKTAAGGEIDCLDPGGFGVVTITKAITFDCGGGEGGQVGSILVAGTPGITINAATTDHVILRNLDINGIVQSGSPGTHGINVLQAASVTLENVDIMSFNNACINLQPTSSHTNLFVFKSVLQNCAGGGVVSVGVGGINRVNVSDSQIKISGVGVTAGANTQAVIYHSTVSNNAGGGVLANDPAAEVSIDLSTVSSNQVFGVHSTNSAIVRMSNSSVAFNNGTGLLADASGQILTWQNNWVAGNTTDGGRTGTIAPQ
jgi:hypothetical protein